MLGGKRRDKRVAAVFMGCFVAALALIALSITLIFSLTYLAFHFLSNNG